jgi:putative ABC transport system permease protein
MAIRAALGAGRGRMFQQLLVEALVSAAGTSRFLAAQVPRADEIALDGRVLLFVVGASIVAAVLAGALPACASAASI